MDTRFAAIASEAARRYSESSSKIQLDNFISPKITTVDQLIKQVELQNAQFAAFRAKRHAVFGAMAAAMKPVEVIGEIAAGIAEEGFPPAQNIFSAVMYLIKAAKDTSAMYDGIIDLFEQLQDFTARLNIYTQYKLSPPLKEKLTNIMATLFEVLVISTQEVRRGRFKAYFKRLFGVGSPVKEALERLQALTTGEEKLVLAETYGSVSMLHDTTERVETLVTLVNENVRNLRLDHLGQIDLYQRDKLKAVLEPSPFADDFYQAFTKLRIAGTGDWILEDETLLSWIAGEKKHIWICGSPGTGKSFLTARLIQWGIENLGNMAYFFFRENNPETKSVLQAIRDVAYQMSESDATYAKALTNSLQSAEEIKTVASAFRRLLVQPFQNSERATPTYIFLDGIDEAYHDEIDQLLFQLAPSDNIDSQSATNIHVALVGRSYMTENITERLDPSGKGDVFNTIQITTDRSGRDVAAYIANGVAQSRILAANTPEFRQEIIATMEKQVDGLFILAKFMLAEVNRKRHPRSIRKSLETFPKEIDGMLLRTLESLSEAISPEEAEDLNEMLRWMVCAEEALSLEQLEAVLILQFGDLPFRLEELLRGQYACFFELEREDGLTTDDLIKEFERKQRLSRRETIPVSKSNPERRVAPGEIIGSGKALMPKGKIMPKGQEEAIRRLSMSSGASSPSSAAQSIDFAPISNEIEYRSKKSTTSVSFFHSTVRAFFRNFSENMASALFKPTIHFDNVEARLHIVKTCLRIFSDMQWFEKFNLGPGKGAIKQYAAWYWQEHLAALDPAVVNASDKRELAPQIVAMLLDEATINEWTFLYLKNNEGLEVLNEYNLSGILRWFSDVDVVGCLTGPSKDFALSLAEKPSKISEPIGRQYAKAWLCADFEGYIPTVFCFDIVQSAALMASGYNCSGAENHWLELSLDERIAKASEWTGYPETGVWHRRIGSTYLTLGRHDDALAHYNKALEMDNNKLLTYGRIAYCLSKDRRYVEALDMALECVVLEEQATADGRFTADASQRSKWRLYKDYYLIAQCYYHTFQVEESLEYYRKAIAAATAVKLNPSEQFQSEVGYLETLYNENMHSEMMRTVEQMSLQVAKKTQGENRLVEMFLGQANKRLVLDWIPKAASTTGKTSSILQLLEMSIWTAHDARDLVIYQYLRLAYGAVYAYSHLMEEALALFERISFDEYRPRGTIIVRQAHAISFQRLAALYKRQLLHAGINSKEAADWVKRLEVVRDQQDKHQGTDTPLNVRGSDINMAAIYLGLYHHLSGNTQASNAILKPLVLDSLDLLADSEPENDVYALDNLLWLMTAAGDVGRAKALGQSMRRVNPNASMVTTQSESPVLQRLEPKLPDIQLSDRSCAQCLHNISCSEDLTICLFCMECFCLRCMENVIKTKGNATRDKDRRKNVICRSDHDWFVVQPLNRTLHTGEILEVSEIKFFGDWEEALRKEWMAKGV
ncbi:NACHT and TPR domain protein [Cordyceps fumosorosea ARSEF 2679]|uniref:NACHT and TPR domain protein n=1 Tax=Cordyceps fumosorosea (strain ARSEF 2679) TaxID=1081104 RepID=A0A168EHE3_CORFA|nr:NACHT and TPR domain protein [Cordyceps fumosorosea ARSEF 2679]OAA73808.1 NACHT and TPR domain protein [Cordyceps fumosorosea ARSEF 2679]